MTTSDKRSPAQVLADRRTSGVSVRANGTSPGARWPEKRVDPNVREAIDRFQKAKGGGR